MIVVFESNFDKGGLWKEGGSKGRGRSRIGTDGKELRQGDQDKRKEEGTSSRA